jgi:hypothetical protein
MLGLSDLTSLPPDQRELLLDIGQFTLDIIGIFEPTPIADLTSAVVSLFRSDWTGAAMSTAGAVPYIGDLAKLGKLPKYLGTVERAVQVARTSPRFAAILRPVLEKLLAGLNRIPANTVPAAARGALDRMKLSISDFLRGTRAASRFDQMADDLLRRVLGSTQNVGELPRKNARTIVEFFDRNNVAGKDPAQWAELARGIDLHAVEPVSVVRFKPGDLVAQYVETGRPASRQVGQWMIPAQGGVSHRNIGLSEHGRVRKVYRVKQSVEVLKSKAASAADHWTGAGPKTHTAVTVDGSRRVMKPAEQVAGGGDQFFLPRAWEFLEEVPARP